MMLRRSRLNSTLINLVRLSRRLLTTDSTDFTDRNKFDPCHPRNRWLNFKYLWLEFIPDSPPLARSETSRRPIIGRAAGRKDPASTLGFDDEVKVSVLGNVNSAVTL